MFKADVAIPSQPLAVSKSYSQQLEWLLISRRRGSITVKRRVILKGQRSN